MRKTGYDDFENVQDALKYKENEILNLDGYCGLLDYSKATTINFEQWAEKEGYKYQDCRKKTWDDLYEKFKNSENNDGKIMVKTVLEDEESKKLLSKKEELERELERINTRLANKELEVNLLNKLEIGKWYRFTIALGLPEVIFRYSEGDFIRDDNLWVHKSFSITITKMQSSFEHRSSFFLIPINDLDNVKEIEECFVKHMIEDEISQLRCLADL